MKVQFAGIHVLTSTKKRMISVVITLVLTIYQLIRLIAFINVYGGIEHDGGWMLSISRSLAEQGTYTTMVSTIVDPNVPGGINVDQKFDVQAPDGRIWFFTGNGVGPASIVPDAVILKLLGTDFWSLHIGPLIFYTLFLLLAAYILYQLAGLGTVVLFHGFLFFYPHLSIFLGYEAMGEVPGMVYVLWAYLAFAAALKKPYRHWWPFFLTGLVAGLAINAKLITLWSLSGIFVWAGFLWLVGATHRRWSIIDREPSARFRFTDLLALGGGTVLLPLLWELVHGLVLTRVASFALYLRNAGQRVQFILDDGSGVGLRIHSGAAFFWDKFFLLEEVTHPQRWVIAIIFTAIFAGGLVLLWLWRGQSHKQSLLASMWLGWLVNTIWFVGLAKTGWSRHYWFGLILAMMLICVVAVMWLKLGLESLKKPGKVRRIFRVLPLGAGVIFMVLIGWGFISQPYVWGFFLPDDIVSYWQEKQLNNKYHASLPWIIIPRAAQAEIVDYVKQLPFEAHIYFPDRHKSAEITPQTGRIHYPLNRRTYVDAHPADIVLIGPSVISPWKDPIQREELLKLVARECPHPAIKNDFYMICPIAENLSRP